MGAQRRSNAPKLRQHLHGGKLTRVSVDMNGLVRDPAQLLSVMRLLNEGTRAAI